MSIPVQSSKEEPDYFYLRRVTLGQFFEVFKHVALWWLGLSIGTALLGVAFPHKASLDWVPTQFWIWLLVAIFSWILRGETIHIKLPKLSFVTWVLLNSSIAGAVVADALLPVWASPPICWGVLILCLTYQDLLQTGKANFETAGLNARPVVEV